MNRLKAIKCWWFGHDWDSVHGYYDRPNFGATCQYCGKKAMTIEEWKALK